MKKSIIALFIATFCSLSMFSAKQLDYDIKIGKLYYKIMGTGDEEYAKVLGGSPSAAGSLTSVVIPSSIIYQERSIPVKVVEIYAFSQEINLSEITIPSSIVSIGHDAFQDCNKLQKVYIDDLTSWCNMSISDNPLKYAKNLYVNGEIVHDIIIPDGVTSIPSGRFYSFSGITSITLPNSVKSIGDQSFYQCTNLSSVNLGDSVETIGSNAFRECHALTAIEFSQTLTTIGEYSFAFCNLIEDILLPAATTTLGDYAFGWCSNLVTVTSMSKQPLVIPLSTFPTDTYSLGTLTVPAGKKNTYIQTSGWSQFTTIEELDPVIDIKCSDGGYISLNDNDFENDATYTVISGTKLDIQVVPEKGKCIGKLIINGLNRTNSLSLDGKLTLKSIQEDYSIQVTFVDAYSLTMSSNEGGQLLLDKYQESINQIWLPQTSQHTITIKAEKGYRLKSFIVNGNDVYDQMTSTKMYQINSLDENMIIQAVFEKIWEVSCEYSAGGHLLINDELVNQIIAVDGDQVKLAITVETGYHLQSILANGVDITEKIENGSFKVEGVHSDLHFVASFMKNTYLVTYLVDGEEYKQEKVLFEAKLQTEPYPEKEGYTFSGWSEIPEQMPAHDATISGSFTVNSYTVTFIFGDEVLTTESVDYGATIPLPESLDSERYTLLEWLNVPETMPAHDITIYADFTDGMNAIYSKANNTEYYQFNGVKRSKMQRGLNIVKMKDGGTKKILVR